MKISIITVCYNSAQTIQKTFNSITNQTYTNIEYIVVDGGSTDDTISLIKKNEKNISKWISEPDKGLYDAMNKGIKLATGDLVGILNSDDSFLDTQVLKKVANFHSQNKVDASIGNIIQHNTKGEIKRRYSAENWSPEKLKIGFMPPHPAIFFNKILFDRFKSYRLDFKIGADYELITRFFLRHKISWMYSEITTTAMLIGGVSSSGLDSYQLISKEIKKALELNDISFWYPEIYFRGFWKIKGFLKR